MRRRPVGLLIVVIGALSAALGGPVDARGEGRPHLVVDEPVFDFGTVDQGTPVEHVFRLPNRGDGDLHVDHVKSSCGCTVAVVSDRVVGPNGEARVAVSFDTGRVAGRTTKTITVYTDDPNASATALSLTGVVAVDLAVTPTPLYLGRVRRGEAVRREVVIAPGREGGSFVVDRIEHVPPALRARLEARPDGPGQRLVVELDRDVPLGRFNETLTLRTTSPRQPVITLPVLGSVEGDVVVLPPQVTFGVTRGGETAARELYVRNRGARPVTVTGVAAPVRVASCTVSTVEDGQEYRVTVRLRDGLPPGRIEAAVEIFTDHPDERRLVVPLYAIVRDARRRG